MESVQSYTKIEETSISSVDKCLENLSSEMYNNNWRNIIKTDSYCSSISNESSGNTYPIDENSNVLNDIVDDLADLKIGPSIASGNKKPEKDLFKFKNLKIDPNSMTNGKTYKLAGKIESVIVSMGIALVKALVAKKLLLDIDTPLFFGIPRLPSKNSLALDVTLVGHIDDVFGPIDNPMYSVRLKSDIYKSLKIQEEIYYSEDHPNTTLISLEKRGDESFYLIRTKRQ